MAFPDLSLRSKKNLKPPRPSGNVLSSQKNSSEKFSKFRSTFRRARAARLALLLAVQAEVLLLLLLLPLRVRGDGVEERRRLVVPRGHNANQGSEHTLRFWIPRQKNARPNTDDYNAFDHSAFADVPPLRRVRVGGAPDLEGRHVRGLLELRVRILEVEVLPHLVL